MKHKQQDLHIYFHTFVMCEIRNKALKILYTINNSVAKKQKTKKKTHHGNSNMDKMVFHF